MTVIGNCELDARSRTAPSATIKAVGYVVAGWCLGFAAVNAWDLVTGRLPGEDVYSEYAAGLAAMSVLVLLLKVTGAIIAVAAARSTAKRRPSWLLAAALWGAASLLVLYSAGNLVIALGTVVGLMEPSAAWTSAGGLTTRSVGYVVFFLIGAALFTVMAVSHQRRYRTRWTALVSGALGAPALLGGVLVVAPALLAAAGLMPP